MIPYINKFLENVDSSTVTVDQGYLGLKEGWGVVRGRNYKGAQRKSGGRYFHYLDCGDGVYRCVHVKTYQTVYFKHVVYCTSNILQ